jgi:hypothetical protein
LGATKHTERFTDMNTYQLQYADGPDLSTVTVATVKAHGVLSAVENLRATGFPLRVTASSYSRNVHHQESVEGAWIADVTWIVDVGSSGGILRDGWVMQI